MNLNICGHTEWRELIENRRLTTYVDIQSVARFNQHSTCNSIFGHRVARVNRHSTCNSICGHIEWRELIDTRRVTTSVDIQSGAS
jgi:hypothetical protein